MFRLIIAAILSLAFAAEAFAEFNFQFPRTRMFRDIGPKQKKRVARRPTLDMEAGTPGDRRTAYDAEEFRTGGGLGWSSKYLWRDFLVSDSDFNGTCEAFAMYYGVEASFWLIRDFSNNLDVDGPLEVDYRLSYTRTFDTSVNTVAYTFRDFGDATEKLGMPRQGFGDEPLAFDGQQHELTASSYWFNEAIQEESMNYFLGGDTWWWIEETALRAQAVVGVFANKTGADWYLPNSGRILASVVFQAHYHTDHNSFPGSNFFGEMIWDWRDKEIPVMAVFGVEYFMPWGDDQYRHVLQFTFRVEVAF